MPIGFLAQAGAVAVGRPRRRNHDRTRSSPYKLEIVRRHEAHMDLFRNAVVAGQGVGEREDTCEPLEFVLRRFAQIDKICVGKGKVLDAAIAHVGRDDDELIGILIRKCTQQHGIGDTEDGRARADAQGDR